MLLSHACTWNLLTLLPAWKIIELLSDKADPPEQSSEDSEKSNSAFLFGYSSVAHSLCDHHPSTTRSQYLLHIYEERVAPVIMIFHKPSIRKLIYKTSTNAEYLDRISEAVAFAISLRQSPAQSHQSASMTWARSTFIPEF